MRHRLASLAILVVYLTSLGCHSMRDIPISEAQSATDTIVAVVYPSGEVVEFDAKGGTINSYTKTIDGTEKFGGKVSIPVDETLYVRIKRTNNTNTALLTAVIVLGAAAVVAAVVFVIFYWDDFTSNCPFVYSFDGKEYVFDAQPLGGAFSRGLERTDLSRLEHLRPVDGEYHVLVRNEELKETQYLDEVKLVIVDHPAATRVVPDSTGSLHVIGDVVTPSKATDEAGNDIHRFFTAPDEIAWQTKMSIDESWRELPPRHELTFEFPRPHGVMSADLLVKAGNAQWGSEMIHRLLALHGDAIDTWYQSMDSGGAAMDEWTTFNTREELYSLRLYVLEGDQWVSRAWIPGGASLVTEERVIPIDLAGVRGDVVKIRVLPPRGFWNLDFLGLEFENDPSPRVTTVPLHSAITNDRVDVASLMSTVDGRRHVMPRVGDEVTLEFAAPGMPASRNRTVFLDMRGYYHAHVDKTQPEQKDLLDELARDNGRVVEYAMELYMKWRMDLLSQR